MFLKIWRIKTRRTGTKLGSSKSGWGMQSERTTLRRKKYINRWLIWAGEVKIAGGHEQYLGIFAIMLHTLPWLFRGRPSLLRLQSTYSKVMCRMNLGQVGFARIAIQTQVSRAHFRTVDSVFVAGMNLIQRCPYHRRSWLVKDSCSSCAEYLTEHSRARLRWWWLQEESEKTTSCALLLVVFNSDARGKNTLNALHSDFQT